MILGISYPKELGKPLKYNLGYKSLPLSYSIQVRQDSWGYFVGIHELLSRNWKLQRIQFNSI